jgi:hypothetical protein
MIGWQSMPCEEPWQSTPSGRANRMEQGANLERVQRMRDGFFSHIGALERAAIGVR